VRKGIRYPEDHMVTGGTARIIDDIRNGGIVAQSNGLAEGIFIHAQFLDQAVDAFTYGRHILRM
jgi:CHASE2 domain-containing sensor protein